MSVSLHVFLYEAIHMSNAENVTDVESCEEQSGTGWECFNAGTAFISLISRYMRVELQAIISLLEDVVKTKANNSLSPDEQILALKSKQSTLSTLTQSAC